MERKIIFLMALMLLITATIVSADHTATSDLQPEWSPSGEMTDYTIELCNDGPHEIDEIRIYENPEYSGFSCEELAGWTLAYEGPFPSTPFGEPTGMCWWYANTDQDPSNSIAADECETFEFSATVPTEGCSMRWYIETRDEHGSGAGDWNTWSDFTSVDDAAPQIEKNVDGIQYGDCPPGDGEVCWITSQTVITAEIDDVSVGAECDPPSGVEYCDVEVLLDDEPYESYTVEDNGEKDEDDTSGEIEIEFQWPEDSKHTLDLTCYDKAGNVVSDTEVFKVDNTAPETEKDYGMPAVPDDINDGGLYPHYITTSTPVTLTQEDGGDTCAIGTENTWYLNEVVDDAYCDSEAACAEMDLIPFDSEDDRWNIYEGAFTKDEESCHMIQYYSVDKLGNTEAMKHQCVYVDDTPPRGIKTIEGSFINCTENPEYCGDENVDGWVSVDNTRIALDCVDQSPHPVKGEEVCYQVTFDDQQNPDLTREYCSNMNNVEDGVMEDGWCCANVSGGLAYWVQFQEDTLHGLEYYCKDALGNENENDLEYFRVDSLPPVIEKDMFGFYMGDCPSGTDLEHGDCYVADDGTSGVNLTVYDNQTYPECAVDDVNCTYKLLWGNKTLAECNDAGYDYYGEYPGYPDMGWCVVEFDTFGEEGREIFFTEDSTHLLELQCEDAVGNKVTDVEEFLVDSTPPETEKTYGEPTITYDMFFGDETKQYRWITPDTNITLQAEDEKVGTESLYYMWEPLDVEDGECYEECSIGMKLMPEAFTKVDGNEHTFQIDEGSCHYIEFYSVDKLGNKEVNKHQCVFVDDLPPETTKVHGEPIVQGEGFDYVTQDTAMTLDCADASPHPVGAQTLYWRFSNYSSEGWSQEDASYSEWHSTEEFPIDVTFPEDCWHDLEYYCVDTLGNKEEKQRQYYVVDSMAPVIDKQVKGPQMQCPMSEGGYEQCSGWDCLMDSSNEMDHKDFEATIRYGQNTPDAGGWELAIKNPDEGHEVDGHYGWTSGDYEPFTYTYDSDTGMVTLEVGSKTLEYEYMDGKAFEYLAIIAKGEGDKDTHVRNIEVNGESLPDVMVDDSYEGVRIWIPDVEQGDGFTMTGEVALSWDTPPAGSGGEIPGFQIFAMNTHEPMDCYMVDSATEVQVDAFDPDPHPVGDVTCDWWYEWGREKFHAESIEGEWERVEGKAKDVSLPFSFHFPEESEHYLNIECKDGLGNSVKDAEKFIVDKTPPEVNKTFLGPYFSYNGSEWISSSTQIELDAFDPEPHPSGVSDLKYRVTLVDDENCWNECEAEGSGTWNYYEGAFAIGEESCHLIEANATDNVGKVGMHKQCVFVDNTPPSPYKTVSEPKTMWDGADANFYDLADRCWSDGEGGIDCWKVTMNTPINMSCLDEGDHPVDHERVCFNVELDAQDKTTNYCEYYEGEMEEGYCCVDTELPGFKFHEESEHNLKYYCEDALGNRGPVDDEKFKVTGTKFEIPLEMKWNLISVPFVLLNNDPAEVFKDIENIDSVWAYDNVNGSWKVWSPDSPGNLDSIKPGWGYWVLMKNGTEYLTIGGSLMDPATLPPQRDLVPGWNLIGYYGTQWQSYDGGGSFGSPAYCSLYSLIDTTIGHHRWSSLWGYENDGMNSEWEPLNMYSTMYAGKGYWVELDVDDVYVPSTACPHWENGIGI